MMIDVFDKVENIVRKGENVFNSFLSQSHQPNPFPNKPWSFENTVKEKLC